MQKGIAVNRGALRKISRAELEVSFVATGDIHIIRDGQIFLNQLTGQEVDGSLSNIYLRVFEGAEISVFPLLGKDAQSRFFMAQSQASWRGNVAGVDYVLTLKLAADKLFWQVELQGDGQNVDLVFAFDLGLADQGALQSNEAYNSQYIDHKVFENQGFVLASRQGQKQSTGFPVLETGALSQNNWRVDGYLTDGFQFFGKSFKKTGHAEALYQSDFANEVYQYEMAMIALKSSQTTLKAGQKQELVFYQSFTANHPTAVESFSDKSLLLAEFDSMPNETFAEVKLVRSLVKFDQRLNGCDMNQELLKSATGTSFPEFDSQNQQFLSAFTVQNTHIVSQDKELQSERETGEIFLSGNSYSVKNRGLATSSFIYGLFNSQTVIGNTTMNKFLSNQRNHLNNFVLAGQRIFVKSAEMADFQMLNLPSSFEMGYNFARWRYVLADDTLVLQNFVANGEASLQLEFYSEQGRSYQIMVLNQVLLDEIEYKSTAQAVQIDTANFIFRAGKNSAAKMGNPELAYAVKFDRSVTWLDGSELFDGQTFVAESLTIFKLTASQFKLKITGSLDGHFAEKSDWLDFAVEATAYRDYIENGLLNSFKFTSTQPELKKLNAILPWYAHDMMVHYLSPHGLEQYGGAAWGTRDVSQGPIEFFLSTGHFDVAREILTLLFSHQLAPDGTWPQWFMFDEYQPIFSDESHGDVIVWPLFALAEYLEATGDYGFLDEPLPYVSLETRQFTLEKTQLWQHLKLQIQYIKDNFLPGTHLSAYGNGDWDDTLQPANADLKAHMTSSWTDALTYQTLKKLAKVIQIVKTDDSAELSQLGDHIKADFEKYLIVDGVIPGFALQKGSGFEPMIHPRDQKTHMHYRLLPMDRSIIAELASPEQIRENLRLINENLTFHDGVRLMERSPDYKGGVSVNFKRAEQAANFGREIGLLYVHAQIRYVETLAKAGEAAKAWQALAQTVPLGLSDVVSNAALRQANVYFSSSDGDFKTRYEAQANFAKLKSGAVPVKGGWRLYSSGPGIFINQLISHLCGLQRVAEGLLIDPVLPAELGDVELTYKLDGQLVRFHFTTEAAPPVQIDASEISVSRQDNPYRPGARLISNADLQKVNNDSVVTVKI